MRRISVIVALALAALPASVAGQAQQVPKSTRSATVTFRHDASRLNFLPMDTARGVPLIPVEVNGERVCALIDTGAERSVIDLEYARSRGLEIVDYQEEARSISGSRLQVSRALSVEVEVPGQFGYRLDHFAIALPNYTCPGGLDLRFVMGFDFLQKMAVVIDIDRKKIGFLPGGAMKIDGPSVTKLEWNENLLTGWIKGKPARFKLDTGSASALAVGVSHWENYFADSPLVSFPNSIDAGGRKSENRGVREVEFGIGNIKSVGDVQRVADEVTGAEAYLGFSFFSKGVVILDASQKTVTIAVRNEADPSD